MGKEKLIIGLVGPIASGKGTAASYLQEKYGATVLLYSGILRDVLSRIHQEHTRDNMVRLSEVLRQTFGDDLLSKVISSDAEAASTEVVVVDGIRRDNDILYLQDQPGFHLVSVDADSKIRHQRLTERSQNSDDRAKTYEQFLADEQRSTETSILGVMKKSKDIIDNNGDKEGLYQQIDQLINKYK